MIEKLVTLPVRVGLSATRTAIGLSTRLGVRVVGDVLDVVESRLPFDVPGQSGRSGSSNGHSHGRSDGATSAVADPEETATTPAPTDTAVAPADAPATDAAEASAPTPVVPGADAPVQTGELGEVEPEPISAADALAVPRDEDVISPDDLPDTPLTEAEAAAKTVDDSDELVGEFAEAGAEDGAGAALNFEEPWEGYRHQTVDEITGRISELDAAGLAMLELFESAHKGRKTVLEAAERRLTQLSAPNQS